MGKGFWKIITWGILLVSTTSLAVYPGQKKQVDVPEFINSVEKQLLEFGIKTNKTFSSRGVQALFRRWLFDSLEANKQLIKTKIHRLIDAKSDLFPDAKSALKAQYKVKYLEKHHQIAKNILPKAAPIPDLLAKHLDKHPAITATDEIIYATYLRSFTSIYAKKPAKPLNIAALITNSDNNQRMFINTMNNTIARFRHKALGQLLKSWLDEIKEQMTKNKATSKEEKNSLLASKPQKERARLAPIYESIWLETHYRIVDRLIEQELVIIKLFGTVLDKDKSLGSACNAVQKMLDEKSYLAQFDPLISKPARPEESFEALAKGDVSKGSGKKGARHGPGT